MSELEQAQSAKQLCTFLVDGLLFGVDVTQVQEVIRYQEMTPVPLSSNVVRGLINLRGHIVSAIEMRRRLGLSPHADTDQPMNVVVRQQGSVISLLVDEIGDVVDVDESTYEAPPTTLDGRLKELITGVYKLDQQLLLVLDTDNAIRIDGHKHEGASHDARAS